VLQTLDFVALEGAARYEEPYGPEHAIIKQFWEIVHAFTESDKKLLLSFCTGSDRAPIKGLAALRIIIGRAGPDTEQCATLAVLFSR
jgi:ubiquitin-protein ligase E3 A